MYLVVNPPHQITTLGGILILTASHMLVHIMKYMGSPFHLLIRLYVPKICSLLLFWQPLIP